MIISHPHNYLFVEVPHTATTAISSELVENYQGTSIEKKHSTYREYLAHRGLSRSDKFVFCGIRNPMDQAVSIYLKLKNNHKENYTSPDRYAVNGGWITPSELEKYRFVQETNADFARFFLHFHRSVYFSRFLVEPCYDFILRFENLQRDFSTVLQKLGLRQVRPLPANNKTAGKSTSFVDFYVPEIRERAVQVFGPFMRKWNYAFPAAWGKVRVPLRSHLEFMLRQAHHRMKSRSNATQAGNLDSRPKVRAA